MYVCVAHQTNHVDFVSICTGRIAGGCYLSLSAVSEKSKCRLLMDHLQHKTLRHLYVKTELASRCIQHGVFRSKLSKRVDVAPHMLPTTRKETIFLS